MYKRDKKRVDSPRKRQEGSQEEKKTVQGLTEIVFILDRSGSMEGLEADTIGGFNSMMKKQKEEQGEALVSTVLFDDVCEVIHDRVPMDEVKKLTEKEYFVRGCTALLDAVGGAIHHIGNIHKYVREEDRPEKTLFIITTDGMENSSREYSYDKVKKMVEKRKEKDHWEFIFMGANIDAVSVANKFGVDRSRAVRYECDGAGTALNYKVMSKMVSCARACGSAAEMEAAFDSDEMLSDIRKDYEKRHRK